MPMSVVEIKKRYVPGMRVQLVKMDDFQSPPIGTLGTVKGVDDLESILIFWDNGSNLNAVLGENKIKVISKH